MLSRIFSTLCIVSVVGLTSLFAADADMRYYTHEVVIEGVPTDGSLTVCPLYEDKDIAFTARWDDNNQRHYRMQELMQKYGFKGTFFLNHRFDVNPMDYDKLKSLDADLGSHSMTHARIASEININRMFWEVAEIRVMVESQRDQPVNSYVFSDGNFRNSVRPFMQGLIAESLQRSGYTQSPNAKFTSSIPEGMDPYSTVIHISPGDRKPSMEKFEQRLAELMENTEWKETDPCISLGVHVWIYDQEGWDNMEAIYEKYAGNEDWWYCSQTEYGAYRKMLQLTTIEEVKKDSERVSYRIRIPRAADIGSDIPLTLRYSVPNATVLMDGGVVATRSDADGTIFSLSPPSAAKVPRVIGYQPDETNELYQPDAVLDTALTGSLSLQDGDVLTLNYAARPDTKIEDLRIRYILPPKYATPSPEALAIPSGDTPITFSKQLEVIESGEFLWGRPFLLCQLDYLADGKPERLYCSVFDEAVAPPQSEQYRDSSLVSEIFTDRTIWEKALPMSIVGAEVNPDLKWYEASPDERLVFNEYVADVGERLSDELKAKSEGDRYYIVVTDFVANKDGRLISRNLKQTKELYLNGERFSPKQGDTIMVKEGLNRLVRFYPVTKFTGRQHAYFSYEVRGK